MQEHFRKHVVGGKKSGISTIAPSEPNHLTLDLLSCHRAFTQTAGFMSLLLQLVTTTSLKPSPPQNNSSWVNTRCSTTSECIKSEVGFLNQLHLYFFSPLWNQTRLDNSLDLSPTHPLIWARHVISLSIHSTCSNHKFPFSSPCQPARLESHRRLTLPFNFSESY